MVLFKDISKIIIMSDMDGTLLASDKKISEKDLLAIKKFVSLGGKFTVATGRTLESFKQYQEILDLKIPVILYNGGVIYDYPNENVICAEYLPDNAREITEDLIKAMPEIGGEVLRLNKTSVFRNNYYQKVHTYLCGVTPEYVQLSDIPDGKWLKVLFAMSPEEISTIENIILQKNYTNVEFVKSSGIFMEMLPHHTSKGLALEKYRNFNGMNDYKFVAIGDFDNDIEMIENADFGVCPSNAERSVKEVSDMILENSCENGAVSELIDYIIKNCNV